MTDFIRPNDLSKFFATPIRDGSRVDMVLKRKGGPAILEALPGPSRMAVETYTATAQAVTAGGASNPRDSLTGGCTGGAPQKEGRQAVVLDQVRFLKCIESAVGTQTVDGQPVAVLIRIGRRKPTDVRALDLWRSVCLSDMSMERFLSKRGLKPAKSRMADINAGFMAAAARAARAIAETKSPFD